MLSTESTRYSVYREPETMSISREDQKVVLSRIASVTGAVNNGDMHMMLALGSNYENKVSHQYHVSNIEKYEPQQGMQMLQSCANKALRQMSQLIWRA